MNMKEFLALPDAERQRLLAQWERSCDLRHLALYATVRYRTGIMMPSETKQNDFRTLHLFRTLFSDNLVSQTKHDKN